MIRNVATLLRAFQEAEVRLIDSAGIRHPTTIGAMYEGLTADVLKRSIPEELNLQVVSGFIDDGHGNLSGQIDCMLVSGSTTPIPHTAEVKCHIKNVIAVLEIKKKLFSAELADAHHHLRAVLDLFGQYILRGGKETFDVESALYAYAQMTGLVPPGRSELENLPFDLEMLYRSLIIEQISPVRILFGYTGFSSEFAFREAFIRFIKKNIKKPGFGPSSFPQLMVSGNNSLTKVNGQPYLIRLIHGKWPVLVSSSINPLIILLELVWTRLSHMYELRSWFDDDLKMEAVHPLLSCNAVHQDGFQGWHYETHFRSKKYLEEKIPDREWQPAKLTLSQFALVNHLCRHGSQKIDSPEFQKLMATNLIHLKRDLTKLQSERLVGVHNGEVTLLTENCVCVITPAGECVAGDNSGGQLSRWVNSQLGKSLNSK
jgi:hypothetical protein